MSWVLNPSAWIWKFPVAVALLHSYTNGSHEQLILRRLRELLPDLDVTLSSDVSPKYREYERTSTTVANAYVRPIVARYLDSLCKNLVERRVASNIYIMQSNGGLVSPELAREYPVRIVESGPADHGDERAGRHLVPAKWDEVADLPRGRVRIDLRVWQDPRPGRVHVRCRKRRGQSDDGRYLA